MQKTLRPFWLIMVSMATAVFPVCLSPMISSLWPRPMGIMPSMALMPVWSGSLTDFLATMPGAFISTRFIALASIGPLSSMGCPRALTTLPMSASPTGTSTIFPVRFTVSPSLMVWHSPRMAAPTLSASRFKTMPYIRPGNSKSSPAMAFSRPYILAMPSPTEMTVPISFMSISFSKPFICVFISWLISPTFIMFSDRPFQYFFLHPFDLGLEAAVEYGVANLHDHASDERRVLGA